jgi:hypothetical protein
VLSLLRLLMLLMLVLLLRIILSPFDISLGGEGEAVSISLLAPLIGLILLFALEVRQDQDKDFGVEEYAEGFVVFCFGAIPFNLSLYAIMLIGILAGWISHTTGKHW